ncbi:MAG TPA: XdhC family protein [Gemmatimonadaceae bacterium]|jgi:xanthine dehydrogenase accessory factor
MAMSSNGLIDRRDPQLAEESAVVLATLVSATGSTSKKVGAKMIVGQSGRLLGGVTIGGCVDAQVIEAADALVANGGRRLLSISLDDDEAWEIGLTCGGTVNVMLDRAEPARAGDALVSAHAFAADLLAQGNAAVVVTPVEGAQAALVVSDTDARSGSLGTTALDDAAALLAVDVLRQGARVETIDDRQYFFDRLAPQTTLVIVGAGQIAMSLTRFARELEMHTIVVDGRERYATRERFPDADELRVGMPSEIVASIAPTKGVAVTLVAHDYKYELPILRRLLREPVGYIGMLGSKKRGAAMRDMLRDEGFTDDELARIHTPIGLDLGGKSAAEVALSILAEVVSIRSGKLGTRA